MVSLTNMIPAALCVATGLSALGVITFKHPVYAALSLMMTFLLTAMVWLSLQAEFLAFTLILIYVGAVMVLFLFVIMMINAKQATFQRQCWSYLLIGVILAAGFHWGLWQAMTELSISEAEPIGLSVKMLGQQLFTHHVLAFEMAGIILLVAIVSAILITHRGPQSRRAQRVSEQVAVKAADRLTCVKVKSERKPS